MGRIREIELLWDQQPQEATDIDPSWGLSAELAWSAAAPIGDQLWTPGATFPEVVTAAGRGRAFTGNQSVAMTRQGRPGFFSPTFTAVVVFDWASGGANNYPQLLQVGGPENCAFIVGAINQSGGDIALVKGAVAVVGSGLSLTSGVIYALVMSHNAVSGEYYALLRPLAGAVITRESAVNTATPLHSVSGVMAVGAGRRDVPVSWNGNVYFAFASYDFLAEPAGRELIYNPWALIDSQRWLVPVAPAGGAVPNITAVYAENILATSADYRVTLDYA